MLNKKLFEKLAAQEAEFAASDFVCPIISGQPIYVRINGVIVKFEITPKKFEGWGVFKPQKNLKKAKFVREPSLAEKQLYYKNFPTLRFILCRRDGNKWWGIPSQQSDTRFNISGLVPIHLAEETQLFDTVQTRFDGNFCWFESLYEKGNLKTPIYLREKLNELINPNEISDEKLTQQDKDAYSLAFLEAAATNEEYQKSLVEGKIKDALTRAGATYKSYIERKDTYTVEYMLEGQSFKTVIDKSLEVKVAGICINGNDANFDLQSVVGIIRKGQKRHHVVRVGEGGMAVASYYDIHPAGRGR